MALIRNFPVPSDRMAIISTLLNIEDAVVLEYGPEGTTHFSMNFFNKLGQDYPNRLFTTGVDDSDIVMGSTENLERGIFELDALYSPKAIFVLTSSVTSIIGTDIVGLCDSLQSEVQSRLIPVNTSGLSADYSAGLRKIYLQLAEMFVQSATKQRGRYNILGASLLHYRAESDICEIESLLREAFGYELLHCLAMNTTTEALAELGSAELNIVLSNEAVPCAEYLQSITGTPYVYLPPYGYSQTTEFLNSVAAVIGQKVKEAMLQRLAEKNRRLKMFLNSPLLSRTPGTVFLKGDYDTVKGLGDFFNELRFNIAHSVCAHKITGAASEAGIECFKDEKDYLQLLQDIHQCLILADEDTIANTDATNLKICVSHPCFSHRTIAKHLPFMGERGTDMLFEYIQQYVNM